MTLRIGGQCTNCLKNLMYEMQTCFEEVERWQRGDPIESAMPRLSEQERRYFIDGSCFDCQTSEDSK